MNPRKYRTCPGCGEYKPQKANFYWRAADRAYNELCTDCTGPVRNRRKSPTTTDVHTTWRPYPWPSL